MDYNFLPQVIRQTLEEYGMGEKDVLSILRSSGDLYGNPGEGYLVGYWNQFYLFSRSFSQSEYTSFQGVFAGDQISMLELREEGYNSFLEIQMADQHFTVKISSYESKDAEPIIEAWCAAAEMPSIAFGVADLVTVNDQEEGDPAYSGPEETAPEEHQEPVTEVKKLVRLVKKKAPQLPQFEECIDPLVVFVTAMLYVANADGEEAPEELEYIRRACGDERRSFLKAQSYYKDFSYEHFLTEINHLDHTQRLCILSNLMEVGMADGVLHRSEQKAIRDFATASAISEEEFLAIRSVLLVKNQISVFY